MYMYSYVHVNNFNNIKYECHNDYFFNILDLWLSVIIKMKTESLCMFLWARRIAQIIISHTPPILDYGQIC